MEFEFEKYEMTREQIKGKKTSDIKRFIIWGDTFVSLPLNAVVLRRQTDAQSECH